MKKIIWMTDGDGRVQEDISACSLIVKSESMKQLLLLVDRIAPTNASVLLTGESGTGKEVIARSIHERSQRASKPFVAVNCSAIPEALLESELFGHAKGSFTGAIDKKLGLFEEANQGTLMLDEIGELSLPLQAKLLRVIQEKKIKRVGENSMRDIDVRIIAATHRNLNKMVKEGGFREDLFFRLNVIPIHIAPLRDRKEDIAPLARYFVRRSCRINNLEEKILSELALEKIMMSPWKGNVRELENAMERAVLLSDGPSVEGQAITVNQGTVENSN
jgi:transcriptional regulator with GAF, ATPase, and Fis domain